jgi:hypothetical protein
MHLPDKTTLEILSYSYPTKATLEILSYPTKVSGDILIVCISGFCLTRLQKPIWFYQVWKAIETGNNRTWPELTTDLYNDKDNFGKRVSEYEKAMEPILKEMKPFSEQEIEQMLEEIESIRKTIRHQKLIDLKLECFEKGIPFDKVTSIMRKLLVKITPEEEKFIQMMELEEH